MRAVNLGGVEISAQGSPWALFVYQREFSTPDEKCSWYADYDEARAEFEPTGDEQADAIKAVGGMDPLFCLKTLWSCAKCADDAVPPFEPWMRSLEGVSMSPYAPWKLEVMALINAEIFRYQAQGEEQ